jgi:hypothetical protein
MNTFECEGCGELMAQRRAVWTDPEELAMVRELLVLDHTECWEYDDPRMAKLARKFRKDVKRQMLLKQGTRDQGTRGVGRR